MTQEFHHTTLPIKRCSLLYIVQKKFLPLFFNNPFTKPHTSQTVLCGLPGPTGSGPIWPYRPPLSLSSCTLGSHTGLFPFPGTPYLGPLPLPGAPFPHIASLFWFFGSWLKSKLIRRVFPGCSVSPHLSFQHALPCHHCLHYILYYYF